MGACASVPKAMRDEATAARPPEQPKEETPATVPAEASALKEEGGDDKVVEENDHAQSLRTLIDKGEAAKEYDSKSEAEVPPVLVPEPEPEETTAIAPPPAAEVAAEKKPEVAEQKSSLDIISN